MCIWMFYSTFLPVCVICVCMCAASPGGQESTAVFGAMLETDGQCKCGRREEQAQKKGGGGSVFGVNTRLATAGCTRLSGRIQEMLMGVTPGQTRGPQFHKCHLVKRLVAKITSFIYVLCEDPK